VAPIERDPRGESAATEPELPPTGSTGNGRDHPQRSSGSWAPEPESPGSVGTVYPRVLDELLPAAFHETEVYANNPLEADHGRLKARLQPMPRLERDRTAIANRAR
jgi:hypothetical protein